MTTTEWKQVKNALADALKRPVAEREAFLDTRRLNRELRRTVESYLEHIREDQLSSQALITVSDLLYGTAATAITHPALDLGTRVDRYVIVDRLGTGGTGEVFLATDTRLHRKVALKCLNIRSDGEAISKILREARAAARITHANVATVHDVIEHDARGFLVMEYVEGENLASHLRRGRLPLDRMLAIGRQLSSALGAAHARGIIHRDLKPANIQLTPAGLVKILDFGIAHAVSVTTTDVDTTVSAREPAWAGTPGYMSPEQLMGRSIDHRSDIYSLGIILFEMATGHRPYATRDPFELVIAVSRPLPRADMHDPGVPPDLSDVIAKALAIEPNDRFQTASELESALVAVARAREQPNIAPVPVWPSSSITAVIGKALATFALTGLIFVGSGSLSGWLTTVAFNRSLGRFPPFDAESFQDVTFMGILDLVPNVILLSFALIGISVLKIAVRELSRWPRLASVLTVCRQQADHLTHRWSLNQPRVAATIVTAAGACAIGVVMWRFQSVIHGSLTPINTASSSDLVGISRNSPDRSSFHLALDSLILLFSVGLIHVSRLRTRQATRDHFGAVVAVALLLGVTILMNIVPYRLFHHRNFERIDYGGNRCYVIGQSDTELLTYCPDTSVPHNRVIRRQDPAIKRLGVIENIFTPAPSAPRTSSEPGAAP